jgi:type I restriction-modification system DNA methylase subunit
LTPAELKKLEGNLWQSADMLRADSGLKSSEYATPILGLIFLKFADNKYRQNKLDTVKLAKMNMAVNGLKGDVRKANTYYAVFWSFACGVEAVG